MTRKLTPSQWSALAARLRASGEARAAERLNAQLLAATHYGVTGEIELHLPAGVAAAVERLGP